jgi:hypothetical protein
VLTGVLTKQAEVRLSFRIKVKRYDGTPFTILTLGGSTKNGAAISAAFDQADQEDSFRVLPVDGNSSKASSFKLNEWNQFEVRMRNTDWTLAINGGAETTNPQKLIRKISFGGLYENPEWPMGMIGASEVQIDLNSISVS